MDCLPSQSLRCSEAEQWALGVSCRRVVLGWRMKLPLAQGHMSKKWPVKWLSWFLDPSSAPRSLNPSFPKECPNLQTKSRIRISFISSYCNHSLGRQKGKFLKYAPAPLPCEKQLTLENRRSLINSLEHKPGPRLSLPPQRLSQSVLQSQTPVSYLSICPRTVVLLPTQVTVQLQGGGTETSCHNYSAQNWLWGYENRERLWSQPSNFWWSHLISRLLWKWGFHNKLNNSNSTIQHHYCLAQLVLAPA